MKNVLRIALAAGAVALVGCGGRPLAPGKEAAAGALFQSSRGAMGAPGMLAQVMNAGVISSTEIKASCPHGGTLDLKVNLDAANPTAVTYDLTYDGCSFDGHTSQKGTLHMTYEVVTGTTVQVALHLNGHLEYWGDVADHLDVDVTETVNQTDLTAPSTTVSVTLAGTISDTSGTYSFNNEVITFDGTGFQEAPAQG